MSRFLLFENERGPIALDPNVIRGAKALSNGEPGAVVLVNGHEPDTIGYEVVSTPLVDVIAALRVWLEMDR